MVEFRDVKKSRTKKRKLMLWVDESLCSQIEQMKPPSITLQEAIRQVLKYYVQDDALLEGL